MRILHAASEVYPLISTGGLSSVVGALPEALNRTDGVHASVIIPYYGDIKSDSNEFGIEWLSTQKTFLGESFGLARAETAGVTVFLVARDEYFQRKGIYGPTPDSSWDDNAARFSFFSRAVASLSSIDGFVPDIIHCHDWQTSLIPVYLRELDTATVLTIHNLQFQGRYPHSDYAATFLPETLYNIDGIEFWGDWNSLKGGITFADRITTVSPTYASEIKTPEFGCALDGVLREHSHKLTGILNGIDPLLWNPATDEEILSNYSPGNMGGKAVCKKRLCSELGLKQSEEAPLLGMVTRLTSQKGIDLVITCMDRLMEMNLSLAILGTGELWAEQALLDAAERYPDCISVTIAYDDSRARRIFAGADAFLMPSVFEPCGLGQMMAMRYGTVPLVRSVGGLADSVTGEIGFSFSDGNDEFIKAMKELLESWRNRRRWAWYRRRCMSTDFSWDNRVNEYMEVYRKALGGKNR
ncbi:MAG: glycogen synthase GlgA [Candidatus Sabulitectum sp.]|nr:glycogen synthase GlgA [Candidatus Sabulitectum sp.]